METLDIVSSTNKAIVAYGTTIAGTGGGTSTNNQSTVSVVADASLGGNRVVRSTATGCDYADSSNVNHADLVIGITTGAVSVGSAASIATSGELSGFSGLSPGGIVYLGANGVVTQTAPNTGFILQVGVAVSSTRINVNILNSIVLI